MFEAFDDAYNLINSQLQTLLIIPATIKETTAEIRTIPISYAKILIYLEKLDVDLNLWVSFK